MVSDPLRLTHLVEEAWDTTFHILPAEVKRKIKPITPFKLTCTKEIHEMIIIILKFQIISAVKNRLHWDISRCSTFEIFIERITTQGVDDIITLKKFLSPVQFNEFMNTFLPEYIIAKENYERESANSNTKPKYISGPTGSFPEI